MKYGYIARKGNSKDIEVGYSDRETALEVAKYLYDDGWDAELLCYSEEDAECVEEAANIGVQHDCCRAESLSVIFEDL